MATHTHLAPEWNNNTVNWRRKWNWNTKLPRENTRKQNYILKSSKWDLNASASAMIHERSQTCNFHPIMVNRTGSLIQNLALRPYQLQVCIALSDVGILIDCRTLRIVVRRSAEIGWNFRRFTMKYDLTRTDPNEFGILTYHHASLPLLALQL